MREVIKIGPDYLIDQIVEIEDSLGKMEDDPDLSKVIEETVFRIILEDTVDRMAGESIGTIILEKVVIIRTGIGLERDHFWEIIVVIELEVQTIVD